MKFPKEKVVITNRINELKSNSDYFGIFKMKDEILTNYDILDSSIYENLISSTFYLGNFDDVIVIGSELIANDVETFEVIYYTLLALIANVDIYQAMSLIGKSKLLNLDEIKEYHANDGANYSNLLYFSETLSSSTLALIIVNFVKGLSREMTGNVEVDHEYMLFRFFDLINMIFEIGYPLEIIQRLTRAMKIIFNLEV